MLKVLTIGDFHTGNRVGLTPPGKWNNDTEAWLRPLWERFEQTIDHIGTVDILVCNGDLVDGPQEKNPEELIAPDINDQTAWAAEIIDRVPAKNKYIVRGTGYHTDRHGSYEDGVAKAVEKDALDELRLDLNGTPFHWRHVVGRSDIPYGQYTQSGKEMINELLQSEFEDYRAARVLIRNHVHYSTGIWTMDNEGRREAMTCPGLQLRGPRLSRFARGLRTWLYHVGVQYTEVERDGWAYHKPIIFPLATYMERRYICHKG